MATTKHVHRTTEDSSEEEAEESTEGNTEDADLQSNTVREWRMPSLARFLRKLRG